MFHYSSNRFSHGIASVIKVAVNVMACAGIVTKVSAEVTLSTYWVAPVQQLNRFPEGILAAIATFVPLVH